MMHDCETQKLQLEGSKLMMHDCETQKLQLEVFNEELKITEH